MWPFTSKKEAELTQEVGKLKEDYKRIADQVRDLMMSEIIAHHPELEHLMIRDTNARYHLPVVRD